MSPHEDIALLQTLALCRYGTRAPSMAGATRGAKPFLWKSATASRSCLTVFGLVEVRMSTVGFAVPIGCTICTGGGMPSHWHHLCTIAILDPPGHLKRCTMAGCEVSGKVTGAETRYSNNIQALHRARAAGWEPCLSPRQAIPCVQRVWCLLS